MKLPTTKEEKIKFWQKKLRKYQKEYAQLKKQSPARWWHDEHFYNQMRVLESLIISTKQQIAKLRKN